MKEIYLDNAATSKVLDSSINIMEKIMKEDYGNPSSVHNKGFEAEQQITGAREDIARALNCDAKEIVFTSGGTEANNLAIIGGAIANKRIGKHLICGTTEHSSVLNSMKYLENAGFEVTYIPCDENGVIHIDKLADAIQKDTVLVSVMYVNNEVGTISPIEEIGTIISRESDSCIFHVDAVQAVGKLPINLKRSRVNLLSASGHKFNGPKGTGFLYKRKNTKLSPIVIGGGQEGGLRSGTENVPGICAMANSLKESCDKIDAAYKSRLKLRDQLKDGVLKIAGSQINGFKTGENVSPYILNASFKDVRAEVLIHALEEKNIFVSSTAACSVHSKSKSKTLASMGCDAKRIDSAIRFSFSMDTKEKDIDETIKALSEIVPKLSKIKRM